MCASISPLFRSIMNMMTSDSLKSITTGALGQLDLDLCQCETFAVSEPVPGKLKRTVDLSSNEARFTMVPEYHCDILVFTSKFYIFQLWFFANFKTHGICPLLPK